ncbi:hypothetical protein [Staphylococcus simulans]|uniref:hypothetical protein n=1 Tax=Staphylococcus simulans TaxID=1286 RepID=UPI003F7EED8F
MKIAGEFNKPINLHKQTLNVISFQLTNHVNHFTEALINYSNSKAKNYDGSVRLITNDYSTITPSKLNIIMVPSGELNIFQSKVFKDALLSKFEQQVYNDLNINMLYNDVESNIEKLLISLEITHDNYQVDFQNFNIVLKKLLGMFKPDFHNNLEDLCALEQRQLFIDTLVSNEKENIIILLFPECHLGLQDMKLFANQIRKLNMYTIIVTNHPYFIVESDNLSLIKSNGEAVDLNQIHEELYLFKGDEDIENIDTTVKMIAYHEFSQHPYLDDDFFLKFVNK